jgi:putative endonuclease
MTKGFSKKYAVHKLVYYELHADMLSAITREKQLKKWKSSMEIGVDRAEESGVERFVG